MENWFTNILKETNYSLRQGIPIFTEGKNTNVTTPLHDQQNSKFDYVDHYEKDAELFDYANLNLPVIANAEETILRKMIAKNIPKQADLLLDVGCGSAWFAKNFVAKGKKVVSLDISFVNASKAMESVSSPNHAAVVADVYQLPFRENSFDVVVASEILEHLFDPELFVKNLVYILKPDGKLIITTPYNEKLEYNLCVHCNKLTPQHAHLHSFDKGKMEKIMHSVSGKDFKIKVFNNSFLMKMRLHLIFKNTFLWRLLDVLANKIFHKAKRMMVIFTK
jgi:2-polyprenyl-3-methyl-5-hydroxy-6-metoxy-1,4-benzoquinol methylase